MKQPELLTTTERGGTVHSYCLTGGLSTFNRYLACYLGSCSFFNDKDSALKYLEKIEPS